MKRWFVTIVWSLVLALPLQGLAATLPGMGSAAPARPAVAHPCHTVATDDAATPSGSKLHANPVAPCAACAACHGGTAPAPAVPGLFSPTTPTSSLPDWHAPTLPSVVIAGPERPPRAALA